MNKPAILFITPEVAPFAKVGGLADVAGVLPRSLNTLGADCRVILPLYKRIRDHYAQRLEFIRWSMVKLGWRTLYSGLFKMEDQGVTYYFIDNEYYFGHDAIYLNYDFDIERYCFFQRAVLEAMGEPMQFYPDILHCHDWQTGLIPCLLQAHYKSHGFFQKVRCVFTIHNLKYQGLHSYEKIADYCDLSPNDLNDYGATLNGVPNFMKAGIVYADELTTVSPSYAQEILTPYYGEGLDGVLRYYEYKLHGIVNGIDLEEYNPSTDPYLKQTYAFATVESGKAANKRALQEEVGLPTLPDVPLLGMVTRLVDQKGLDLVTRVLDEMAELPTQIVILGTGDPFYETGLQEIAARHPDHIAACMRFDHGLSHRIYAGADLFLMPSLFEPCGLSQMISMIYGTLPVVRETGGLKDTVIPYNQYTGEGNGFSFANINAHEFLFTVKRAVAVYHEQPEAWRQLIRSAMHSDFTWQKSAKAYLDLYEQVINR